MVEQYTTLRYN